MPNELFFIDPYPKNDRMVILLHGLGSDHSSWMFQLKALAERGFRPIAVDVPGFGRSGYPHARWTTWRAAQMIAVQLLDGLKPPVDLIGLSMGGTVVQQLARLRPDKIGRLILGSTFSKLRLAARKNLPYLARRFRQVVAGNLSSQAETVADRIFPEGGQKDFHDYLVGQIRSANPRIYRQAMVSLAAFNSSTWMRKWVKPVLVVAGSEDSTVTMKNQQHLAAILKNCSFEVIEGGGHAITIDHKDRFNELMVDFLDGNHPNL